MSEGVSHLYLSKICQCGIKTSHTAANSATLRLQEAIWDSATPQVCSRLSSQRWQASAASGPKHSHPLARPGALACRSHIHDTLQHHICIEVGVFATAVLPDPTLSALDQH